MGTRIPQGVKDRLITGLVQYLSAQAAGLSKFAVADAFLAIDNYFSALLLDHGIDPPKNHWMKIREVYKRFDYLLKEANVNDEDIKQFYEDWQAVRYSSKTLPPKKVIKYLRITHRILTTILRVIARKYGKTEDELENELYAEVVGSYWPKLNKEIGDVHEAWQAHLEELGEKGCGSKLLNKLLFNPSNFCGVCLLTDDELVKDLMAGNDEIIRIVGSIYNAFLRLIMYIWNVRAQQGISLEELTNFTLSLRIGYHGRSAIDVVEELRKLFSKVLSQENANV